MNPEELAQARPKHARALRLKQLGMSQKDIASELGICQQYAGILCRQAQMWLENAPHWTDGLSTHTINVLTDCRIESREELTEAVLNGRLSPKSRPKRWGYGQKTHREICSWLGMPPAQEKRKRPRRAPEDCLQFLKLIAETYKHAPWCNLDAEAAGSNPGCTCGWGERAKSSLEWLGKFLPKT